MNCLVIGGTGFVGSHVCKALLERGDHPVAFDMAPNTATLEGVLGERIADLPVVSGDITYLHQILHSIRDHRVSHVVHLAAALTAVCNADPPRAIRVGVDGFANVLEACRLANIRRLVWASSAAVFGGGYTGDQLIENDSPHVPNGVYGAIKAFSEHMAAHYFKAFHVDSIGIRFSLMSGPGMARGLNTELVEDLMRRPARGEATVVRWTDDTVDWLWVEDAAQAVLLALDASTTQHRCFNIGGDYRPIREVAAYIRHVLPDVRMTLQAGRAGFAHKVDASVIERELGFRPAWTVEQQALALINAERKRVGLPEVSPP